MKKLYISSMIVAVTMSVVPAFTFAQVPPPPLGGDQQGDRPIDAPRGPGALLSQDLRDRVKENEDSRNLLLQNRASSTEARIEDRIGRLQNRASSTEDRLQEREDLLRERASSTRARLEDRRERLEDRASSTQERRQTMQEMRDERTRDRKEVRLEVFKIKKDNLVKQLTRALDNLKQIRERIASRITKAEGEGRDMTDAKAALVTADAKIAAAQVAIDAFAASNATASSTGLTAAAANASSTASSTIVEIEKPRKVGDAAIKAVKDAREALNKVVRAIAHSMGFDLDDRNATSTPRVVIPPTATSTNP